jgi:hypothetical protein
MTEVLRAPPTPAAPPEVRADDAPELTILMPCLNEARTLAACITKAQGFLRAHAVRGEVLIADNGSSDGSATLARALGARVVEVSTRGYGAALIAGIAAARGRYVIMGDADDSYDFSALQPFLAALRQGAELVMGDRFGGGIAPGAMPALHRYLGNPVLSFIGRLFFRVPVRDFHCGLRGFDRLAIGRLGLCCEGMEFASEMVVKAAMRGLAIAEVPTTLWPDGRDRPPHLRSWRDGWRHLRFLLLFSPRWLFLYPGLALSGMGVLMLALLAPGPLMIGGIGLDVHTMLYAAGATLVGVQVLSFALCAMAYGVQLGILPESPWFAALRARVSLEAGLVAGGLLIALGLALSVHSVVQWEQVRFGAFDPRVGMRIVIPSLTVLLIGLQVVFASMLLAVIGLRSHAGPAPAR